MAIGDVSPSSFEAYEGIRILIPGAVVVTAYGAAVATVAPSAPSPASNALGAIVGALLVGLFLLFLDAPVKSAAFRNQYLPELELRSWNVDADRYGGYLSVYYAMLDTGFPATIRNRSLYMGSVFRIGFEAIYVIGLTSVGVLVFSASFSGSGPHRGGTGTTSLILYLVAVAHFIVLTSATIARANYKLRGTRVNLGGVIREVWGEIRLDIRTPGLFGLILTVILVAPALDTRRTVPIIGSVAVPLLVWAVMYFRGRPDDSVPPLRRRRLTPPTTILLYAVAASLACIEAARAVDAKSTLDSGIAFGWGAATLVPAVLMAVRGHERKLNGSFNAQTTWMRLNKEALIAKYKLRACSPLAVRQSRP